MNIGNNPNIIISTSRRTNPSFLRDAKKTDSKQPALNQNNAAIDRETKYSIIGGLAVLGGIGLALLNRDKVLDIIGKEKIHIKRCLHPTPQERIQGCLIKGGPDIDLSKGPGSLHKAWSDYIGEIQTNRKNNAEVFKRLRDAFEENAEEADRLEALAQKRLEHRGGIWA